MREIRFRAWDKKHKKMAEVYTLGLTGIEHTTICTDGQLYSGCGKDDIELMQFTGLKDKNGKEIYEGDIVRCGDYVEDADAWNEWEREVTWDEENGSWLGIDGERNEVIGNIYENPELLIPSNTSNK